MFTIQNIIKQCTEKQSELYSDVLAFEKASDSIRKVSEKSWEHMASPQTL